MSDPSIVKVLLCLKDSSSVISREHLIATIGELPHYIDKALNTLCVLGVVEKKAGGYRYKSGDQNDHFSTKLLRVYRVVNKERTRDLFVRGLICQVPQQYPIHLETLLDITQREGLDREGVLKFLQEEMSKGYVRRIGIVFSRTNSIGASVLLPVYLTPYHWLGLRDHGDIKTNEYDTIEEMDRDRDPDEEDYVLAQYPAEMVGSAREFMREEGKELVHYLRGMDTMFWGGWLWRRKRAGP